VIQKVGWLLWSKARRFTLMENGSIQPAIAKNARKNMPGKKRKKSQKTAARAAKKKMQKIKN
jgi:hypothetical protein